MDCQNFFQDIAKHIPKIDDGLKQTCVNQITITELDAVIGCHSLKKAPGSNGLTGDFYRHFWVDLRDLLLQVFTEIFETCASTNNETWTWKRSQNYR